MPRTHLVLAALVLAAGSAACTEDLDDAGGGPATVEARLDDEGLDPLDEGAAFTAKQAADVAPVAPADVQGTSCGAPKVLICHYPPGNPDNAHTLCVSQNAVDTHQTQHGDTVGMCAARTTPPPRPQCMDFGATCTADAQCCNTCAWGECIDRT